jgi:hypothetical protein
MFDSLFPVSRPAGEYFTHRDVIITFEGLKKIKRMLGALG